MSLAVHNTKSEMINVWVDMAVCNLAQSLAYIDKMESQLKEGGGQSTLYTVLTMMGGNTSLDVPMSQMIRVNQKK